MILTKCRDGRKTPTFHKLFGNGFAKIPEKGDYCELSHFIPHMSRIK
jgi:hypothetical protein